MMKEDPAVEHRGKSHVEKGQKNSVTFSSGTNEGKNKECEDVGDVESKVTEADPSSTTGANERQPATSKKGNKNITIGEYNVTVPEQKVPLLGVMASAIVLFVAVQVTGTTKTGKDYGIYGTILSVVAFITALVTVFLPNSCAFVISLSNYFLFIWSFIGACFMTFENGPFTLSGNGYFSSWGCAVFSGMAACEKAESIMYLLRFLAASFVVMIAMIFEISDNVGVYKGEKIFALIVACATILGACILTFRQWWKGSRGCLDPHILCTFALLWIISASIVTFRGPFKVMGNGYFGSWAAVIFCVKAASQSWTNRNSGRA